MANKLSASESPRFATRVLSPLAWLLFSAILLAPFAPPLQPLPRRDSGVFLYAGWQILQGRIPYLQIWDHKPPLIYTIDAAGLLLGSGSLWGVWMIEVLSLAAALVMCASVLSHAFGGAGNLAAIICAASFTLVSDGGNLTEEYALPLQFLILGLFYLGETRGSLLLVSWPIGILASMIFLLKPNLVGVSVAVALYVLITRMSARRFGELLRCAGAMISGAASPLLIALLFARSAGALSATTSAVFTFNAVYSEADAHARIWSLITGIRLLSESGLFPLGLIGWAFGIRRFFSRERSEIGPLLRFGLILFPLELIFSSVTGESYPHYYIAWLPVCALLSAYTISILAERLDPNREAHSRRTLVFALAFVGILNALVAYRYAQSLLSALEGSKAGLNADPVMVYLNELPSGEPVLFWGAEARYNFVTRHVAPTRFVYQYPLFQSGYVTQEMIQEFEEDLSASPECIVIDTSPTEWRVPPIDPREYDLWRGRHPERPVARETDELIRWMRSAYEPTGKIEGKNWIIYKRRDSATGGATKRDRTEDSDPSTRPVS